MTIKLIWAMAANGAIGKNKTLPWHLPEDLKYFKKVTSGKPVIMGYTTYCSIGKALPHRRNIVLSHHPVALSDAEVVHSLDDALKSVKNESDVFVIGGATVYKQFLPLADELYVTLINQNVDGDVFFPEVDWSLWKLVSASPGIKDEKNNFDYSFTIFQKIK